jgi:hypothetical protein
MDCIVMLDQYVPYLGSLGILSPNRIVLKF